MSAGPGNGRRWRIGTVPYRVAQPLTLGLAEHAEVELTIAPPAQLAAMLRADELDVALASSVLAVGEDALPIWNAGPVIASAGPVRSVLLMVRPGVEPTSIRHWVADPHSRTGQALASIALREHLQVDAHRLEAHGEELFAAADHLHADAVQVIGDPALRALIERPDWTVIDLGEVWHQRTGLPFVFAGWVSAPGAEPTAAAQILSEAAERGLAARTQIADQAALDSSVEAELGVDFFRHYLLEDMQYRLPAETVRQSLAEFERRLAQARVQA